MIGLIVGGDRVEPIKSTIMNVWGVEEVVHWNGRKKNNVKKVIPNDTKVIIMLCDYISHNLAKKVKSNAQRLGIPVIYCKHSANHMCKKLKDTIPPCEAFKILT